MKKGKLNRLTLSHKNGRTVLRPDSKKEYDVTESDVNNWDELVKDGSIIEIEKPESDLMKLKKDELQEKCIALDIDYTEDDNKSELVERIEAAEKDK